MSAVELLIEGRKKDLGGFSVSRILPFAKRRSVGPFVFLDEMGPAVFAPGEGIDVRPHPHIGLATITYLFDGGIRHRDTLGVDKVIEPGAVNWMTAGRGIAHSERTPAALRASGHTLHGLQAWVALPSAHEEDAPAFDHYPADAAPDLHAPGAHLRVIAGTWGSKRSPVVFPADILYVHAELQADAPLGLPTAVEERAVYVVSGHVDIDGTEVRPGQLAVIATGAHVSIHPHDHSRVMILGGAALDAPRHIEWNFVSSRKERIEQAKADWRASIAGGWTATPFAMVPGERDYIPLPGDPEPEPPEASEDCPFT